MNNKKLYTLWGVLFILCALLGFIPQPVGLMKALLVLLSILFFVPGCILLYRAAKSGDLQRISLIRTLSLISLGATLVLLVLNFLSASASDAAGSFLYGLLVVISAPMICSQYWIVSLFLWACLLMTSQTLFKKAQNRC